MANKITKEETVEPGVRISYEGVVVESAVDEGSMILALEKVGVNAEFQLGGEKQTVWMNFIPPSNKQILVAFARTNAASLPDGCISSDELKIQILKVADAVSAYRNRAKENQDTKSF